MKVRLLSLAHLAFMTFLVHGEQVPKILVEGLSSEDFKDREASQAALLAWAGKTGKNALSSILKLSRGSEDPEIRQRCLEVLRSLSDLDYLNDGQGYLGIMMLEEMADLRGDDRKRACVRITMVMGNSPADVAGVKGGDLITALDGKKWYDAGAIEDFSERIADSKPLNEVTLSIKRGQAEPFDVKVRLGRRPVENLRGIGDDLQLLDKIAKDKHFEKWLKQQE